jgi:CubicO group peptidase (beta-lactamase class C family)
MAGWWLVRPMHGAAVAKYKPYDDAMQSFMKDRGFTGGTLAVMKDNTVLLSRGYGYRDHGISPMSPDTPLRIASISKPITLAAIRKLLAAGAIKTDTKVVDYLSITPPAGKTMEARWKDITIQHLIDHKGGFNRDKSGDPMFESEKIAKALGKTGPPSAGDVITYMAGQPLDFKPGSESQYSNFGYCLLGRVIEKASGQTYSNYIKSAFVIPLKMNSTDLGRTLVPFRNPKEPFYMYDYLTPNVMKPGTGNVAQPDGGFHLEAMDAHGGTVSSAPDLCRWGSHYWLNGQPRSGGSQEWLSFGSLPGNWSALMQRPDGTVIAALFNQRTETSEKVSPDAAIADRLKKANAAIK